MGELTRTLLRLGRDLRYRPLPIIGQRVVIESRDAVEPTLRQLTAPWTAHGSQWDGCDITPGLAKYGLLHLQCSVDARHLDEALRGIPALRANGFARGTPDPDPAIGAEARATVEGYLADLAADLGRCVLKVFLNDDLPNARRFEHNRERYQARLPPELLPRYFPRPFVITDACITNAPAIWLAKHFYV